MDNIAVSSRRQHSSAISRVIIHDDRLSRNNKLIMNVDYKATVFSLHYW